MLHRKIITLFTVIALLVSSMLSVHGQNASEKPYKIGDIIGSFQKSTAVVSIERIDPSLEVIIGEKSIPTYQIDGDLFICAEDLEYYGYKREWDGEKRQTHLTFDGKNIKGTTKHIKGNGNIYYSDIQIYVDGVLFPSFNIGGYSLIKITDLMKNHHIVFNRKYDQERRIFALKGKISLPAGDVAPKGGIKGNIIVYGYGHRGIPEKSIVKKFQIQEGKNSSNYEISQANYRANKSAYDMYIPTNTMIVKNDMYDPSYVGYEIDDSYGYFSGSLYEESGAAREDYSAFVRDLEDFRVDYDQFHLEIFKKVKLAGTVHLSEKIAIEDAVENRVLRVSAIKQEDNTSSSKMIVKDIVVPLNATSIDYEMDVIANENYIIQYDLTLYGIFRPRFGMWVGPAYPLLNSGYYSPQGFVKESSEAQGVTIKNMKVDNLNINIPIPPKLLSGKVQFSGMEAYFNGDRIKVINIGEDLAIFPWDFVGRGYTIKYEGENEDISFMKGLASIEKSDLGTWGEGLKEGDFMGHIGYLPKKVFIDGKFIPAYEWKGDYIILIKDLAVVGFEVKQDEEKKTVTISKPVL
ncbi:hypothetical protein HNQ80_002855 [Anaerosolibacter carboniphilus]|uniref:Uncharacterized protein n=1 Tax=Anaerosolibacter carboniphilus TaxID=1417629 RepID=A0A841KTK7_9FIRM|nr:hypothetical protein [Anaerosolibacter carboniphilus]MBB6216751.1 hypothetical protein [Anaerosolibacter carboniphilus]